MKTLTRREVIGKLLDDDISIIIDNTEYCYLSNLMEKGFKGYKNYTKEELYQEHIKRFNEGVKIK